MKKILISIVIILLLTGCKNKTYTVTFMDNGVTLSKAIIEKGNNITNIEVPSRDGYLFVGWLLDGKYYDESTPIDDDITLTANWTSVPVGPNNHTVTFDFGNYKKTQTVDDGEMVSEPSDKPVMEKHTFLGWYVGDTLYDFTKGVTSDLLLVAKFKKNRITVNYDLVGGSGTIQVEIEKGTIPDRPKNPVKFGYLFVGWLLGGQPYNFDFPLNDDTTIKANFTPIVYNTVSFDTDGGNSIKSQMVVSGNKLLNIPIPVKEGYTFKYWSLLGNKFDVNSKIVDDITLVAVYDEKSKID